MNQPPIQQHPDPQPAAPQPQAPKPHSTSADILAELEGGKGKWMIWAPILLVVACGFVYFGGYLALRSVATRPIISDIRLQTATGWKKFQKTHRQLRKHGFEPNWGKEKDAGAFLAEKVPWEKGGPDARKAELALSRRITKQLRRWGRKWVQSKPTPEMAKLDFAWIAKSRTFDHWSLESEGPRADAIKDGPVPPASLPTPDFEQLVAWAQLRLLREPNVPRNARGMDKALEDVMHLASLFGSTETMKGAHARFDVMKHVIDFARGREKTARGPVATKLRTIPVDLVREAKAALLTMTRKTSLFGPPEEWGRLFRSKSYRTGRCAALSESMLYAGIFRPVLGSRYAIEYKNQYKLLRRTRRDCRLDYAKSIFRSKAKARSILPATMQGIDPSYSSWLAGLPLYDEAIGEAIYIATIPTLP